MIKKQTVKKQVIKRCKKFDNYELLLEIEEFIKSYDPKVNFKMKGESVLNGYDVWYNISVSTLNFISEVNINNFVSKFKIKCEKIKKDCRCTMCYFKYYFTQDRNIPCKKPLKKESKNKCFCHKCNTRRIRAIIACYEMTLNPFKVFGIPLKLSECVYDFLLDKGFLLNINLEENKLMGEIMRRCICTSTPKNYYVYGEGKNNYDKDIGLPLDSFSQYEKILIERYKEEFDLTISNNYVIHNSNILIEQKVANFIENNTCVFYEGDKDCTLKEINRLCVLQKIEANEDLLEAVSNCLISPISLIIGEAGTGKTKSIEIIQRILEDNGISSCGTAFTGKAVDKLINRFKESSVDILEKAPDFPVYTIHTFISQVKKIPKVIIIDEASMLSTPLALAMFEKIIDSGNKIQLILVGDSNQLPPIEWGRFFESLQNSMIPKTRLKINFRIRGDSRVIIQNSKFFMREINSMQKVDYSQPEKFELIRAHSDNIIFSKMKELYMDNGEISIEKLKSNQVICPITVNNGCDLLNSNFQALIKGDFISYCNKKKVKWIIGDKVICLKNDRDKISNGTDGIIKNFGFKHMTLPYMKGGYKFLKAYKYYGIDKLDFDNKLSKLYPKFGSEEYACVATVIMETKFGEYEFPILYHIENKNLTIRHLSLAYAITTHKSQGSEYFWVIYYLPSPYPVTKSNTYTAITRAISKFTIIENVKEKEKLSKVSIFENAILDKTVGDTLFTMIKNINYDSGNKSCSHGQFLKILFDRKYKCDDIWQMSNTRLTLKCYFGHIFKASPNELLNKKSGCKFCMNHVSSMELETANICAKNGWTYISEYPCEQMNGRRFDFLIEINNYKFIVELDGIQHFKFVKHYHKNEEFFNECVRIDALKTYHCITNGIKMLRIHQEANVEECINIAYKYFTKYPLARKSDIDELFTKNLIVSDGETYEKILLILRNLIKENAEKHKN